jgi:hypothetical protein
LFIALISKLKLQGKKTHDLLAFPLWHAQALGITMDSAFDLLGLQEPSRRPARPWRINYVAVLRFVAAFEKTPPMAVARVLSVAVAAKASRTNSNAYSVKS